VTFPTLSGRSNSGFIIFRRDKTTERSLSRSYREPRRLIFSKKAAQIYRMTFLKSIMN